MNLFPAYDNNLSAFHKQALDEDFKKTDHLLSILLIFHWIIASLVTSYAHGMYLLGILGGGVITGVALFARYSMPGSVFTRIIMGMSFMLYSGIFIQQSLGQIEMHFHVFIALAFFIRYKDILPLLAATVTVAVHHFAFNYMQMEGVTFWGTPCIVFNYGAGFGIVLLHAVFVVISTLVFSTIIMQNTQQFFADTDRLQELNILNEERTNQAQQIMDIADKMVVAVLHTEQTMRETMDGAAKQSERVNEISLATESMVNTIENITGNTQHTSSITDSAMQQASEGNNISSQTVASVNRVSSLTQELAADVAKLSNRAQEIGNITTVIGEIADQTNLLALNAAIEAARAGEQGRGFAVVAEEVRNLAVKTMDATNEISENIKAIQQESMNTSESMQDASEQVVTAKDSIEKVGQSLASIVDSVQSVRHQVNDVATAIEQQSVATRQTLANTQQTADIANNIKNQSKVTMDEILELSQMAQTLKNIAEQSK